VLARVVRTIVAHRMVVPRARVLVAVSGGSDSIGLLAILSALRRRLEIDLVVGHVNHRLRGADSDRDEQCAAAAAARAGVPLVRADLGDRLRGAANLEARARELRYRALHRLASGADCSRIATGHTRDDQAETVLLRLIRGSGIGGLAGIEPVRADGVMRPLLDCARSDVEAYVRAVGHPYRSDASNADQRFLRARVRHTLLPLLTELNPAVVDNLARLATMSAAEKTIVQQWSADQLRDLQCDGELDLERLRTRPPELQGHIIRAWLLGSGVDADALTARHVDAVTRLARGDAPSGQTRLRNAVVARRYGRLYRARASSGEPSSAHALPPGAIAIMPGGWRIEALPFEGRQPGRPVTADLWSAVCDATALSEDLLVRTARVGERVQPLGLGGRHRKLSDLFIDRKVPAAERKTYPVVSYHEEIVWVPGVVRTELLRVRAGTACVLRLRAQQHRLARR
jgi:tRNA(Ile)-lysidine synthase